MATLEERIQNLTQEVNPMGSGVMSDQDVERMYNIDIDGKDYQFGFDSQPTKGALESLRASMGITAEPQQSMASSPMQPLVDLGFGEQVNIILNNPADSQISRDAQQVIINELGTGMDIDGFLMEVRKLAPKGEMSDMDSQGINELLKFGVELSLIHI